MKMRVRIDDEYYEVEIADLEARPVLATVDGETFEVWPDGEDLEPNPADCVSPAGSAAGAGFPSPQLPVPLSPLSTEQAVAVLAPIPGVILSTSVKAGEVVAFGQELCILEAMKMKNIIRAARPGKIASVCVAPGDHVHHGQVLFEFAA